MKFKTLYAVLLLGVISQLYGANLYYRYNPFFKYHSQCAKHLCLFRRGDFKTPSPNYINWLQCINDSNIPTLTKNIQHENMAINPKVLNKLYEYFNRDCKYMLKGQSFQTSRPKDPLECLQPKWVTNICGIF